MMKFLTVFILAMTLPSLLQKEPTCYPAASAGQDQQPIFSFGIIADVQYCECEESGTRFYRNSLLKLEEAVKTFREERIDFIVNLGDLVDRDFSSFGKPLGILEGSNLKVHHVAGNHDFSVEKKHKKNVLQMLTGKPGFYSFTHNSFRFIILDGNDISLYGPGKRRSVKAAADLIRQLKEEGAPNAMDWNGGIGQKQIEWLTGQLELSVAGNQKVFILCHFPAWPEDVHNLLNYKSILEAIKPYENIIAWFSGHNHAGNYGNLNMVHFYSLKGMVETPDRNSFAVVEVYRNKIWIKGYGREKSMILAY